MTMPDSVLFAGTMRDIFNLEPFQGFLKMQNFGNAYPNNRNIVSRTGEFHDICKLERLYNIF